MTDIVMRCDVTKNPVGTDTRMIGGPDCACQGCQAAALIASQARRIEELEAVYDAARGLCYGEDWNNGTHAKSRGYRQKLVAAVNAIEPLPPRATLKGDPTP